jgi:hypothetical protein
VLVVVLAARDVSRLITMVVVTVSTFVVEQAVTVVVAPGDWLVNVSTTVTTSNGPAGRVPPPPVVVVDVEMGFSVETKYPAIPAAETTANIAISAPGRIADLVGIAASKPLPT